MPDYLIHDPSVYHGDPPYDVAKVQADQLAAQGLSPAVSAEDGESPSGDAGTAADAQETAAAPGYDDMTVEQLREIMRERGLAYAGLVKADLIETLAADDEAPGA